MTSTLSVSKLDHFGHQRAPPIDESRAAAEQAQQPAFGMRTQGHQNFFQCIWGMGVIDHYQRGWITAAQHTTWPAGPSSFSSTVEDFVQCVVQTEQGAIRRQTRYSG